MVKVGIIFVNAKHDSFFLNLAEKTVLTFAGGWAHVGMYLFHGVFEAIAPEVTISPKDKYELPESCYQKEVVWVEISDKGYAKILTSARAEIGHGVKYSIWHCFLAGLADRVSLSCALWLHSIFPLRWSSMCAGSVASLLKDAGFKGLKCVECPEILTPRRLYALVKMYEVEGDLQ